MKKTIEYIGMLGTAITIWRAVQKDGTERIKEEGGEESLSKLIDYARENLLWKIDSKVILDEICADCQGIKMRLGILDDEYKLQFHLDVIDQMLYEPIHLPCGMALDTMEDLKRAFEDTWQEITDVIEIAKSMNKPARRKPCYSDYTTKEKLKEAHTKFDGKHGADFCRGVLRITLEPGLTDLPSFRMFDEEFPNMVVKSEYGRITKTLFGNLSKHEKFK